MHHHRAHHQYTDTDKDPYNARRGFLYSHIGWLIGFNPSAWGAVDLSDLESDPVVLFQDKYYIPIALATSLGIPIGIAGYGWSDWLGGFVWGAWVRLTISMHGTWLINSLAHASWGGTQPYSNKTTARNVTLISFFTLGESNHNFHHTFPSDYRNGIRWFEPDMSTWFILLCQALGLASDLKTTSHAEVERARLLQGDFLSHEDTLRDLPSMDWSKFTSQISRGRCLTCIDNIVYDITGFISDHPGGQETIISSIGRDSTATFYSGYHPHSLNAEAILTKYRVAIAQGFEDDLSGYKDK